MPATDIARPEKALAQPPRKRRAKPKKRKLPKVFISYRRSMSFDICGRLGDRLRTGYGEHRVIRDIESFPIGQDFTHYIQTAIPKCTHVLVLIDRDWLKEINRREKAKTFDWVRFEVGCALTHGIRIIPVLVNGTKMPAADKLPVELKPLSNTNAVELRGGRDFHIDVDRIMAAL